MNFYSTILIISSAYLFIFNYIVFSKNRSSNVNKSFSIFGMMICFWLVSFGIAHGAFEFQMKLFWFKMGYIGISFIPATFLFFVINFLNKRIGITIYISLFLAAFFSLANFTNLTMIDSLREYWWGYYPLAKIPHHPIYLLYFNSVFALAVSHLVIELFKKHQSVQRAKLNYILFGTLFGMMGSIDYFANYGFEILPFGFLFMIVYPLILTYAIVKYRLLDISLAITRTTIFVVVYSCILGFPIAFAFLGQNKLEVIYGERWWIIPLVISTILATLGPYIYLYFQKKAEDRLLQEQRQYQATLRKASLGMGQIKDLRRLLNLIVHVVTKAVRIKHCKIFLYHEESNKYVMKSSKANKETEKNIDSVISSNELVQELLRTKEPVVYQEIKQKRSDFVHNIKLKELEKTLDSLNAELVVPSFIESKLIAFIILGKKLSGKMYTQDDLVVFSILASQSALAIENAMFYEETKRTHEQLFKAEKMATIGTMADGLSHQINNRLHAMGFIAGDAIDTLKRFKGQNIPPDVQKILNDTQNALVRIEDNVKRGGEIVQGLLTYTRKGEEGFSAVELNKLLDSSIEMVSYKVKTKQLEFVRNFNGQLPRIKGNFTQLQEVIFNIIDNANDAIDQRKDELKEPGYHGRIEFEAHTVGLNRLELVIKDNGMGVKEENMRKIFTPFFTTKLSSKKGTGLGMYVIKQIIEENHKGKVEFTSTFKVGSETKMLLPIYSADLNKS